MSNLKKSNKLPLSRIIATAIMTLIMLYLSLVFSVNLDLFLSQKQEVFLFSIPVLIVQIFSLPMAKKFFMLFAAAGTTGILYILFAQSYIKYRSDVVEITPEITIPQGIGEGQYGSAWFLDKKDFSQKFYSVHIPKSMYAPLLPKQEDKD